MNYCYRSIVLFIMWCPEQIKHKGDTGYEKSK